MIDTIVSSLNFVKEFGIIGYLALFLGIGIFLTAIWLVKHIVLSAEREREHNQKFLSEAVCANTKMIDIMSERMSDIANLCGKILESLSRIENADRFQREEHKDMTIMIVQFLAELKRKLE